MGASGFTNILILVLEVVLIVMLGFFAFARGRDNEPVNRGETAGRAVLVGTFCVTMFIVLGSYQRGPGGLPDVPNGLITLNGMAVAIYIIVQLVSNASSEREGRLKVVEAQQNSLKEPDNVGYAWQLASATLEDYLNRNLSQVKWIFNVAVFVMFCGFVVVCYGVNLALADKVKASLATSASGIITQFIGATFMVIYRSTMAQASSYVTLLERINNIGMAVQVLEKMPDSPDELKNTVRAEIVRSLAVRPIGNTFSPLQERRNSTGQKNSWVSPRSGSLPSE